MATTAPYPAPRVLADVLPKTWARDILLVVGGAGFVGLAAQIAFVIPTISPVPFTLQTFAVLLAGAALGTRRGAAALMLYAAMGLVGVPWFAEASTAFTAGALTATFGYIVGFILAAALVGYLAERGWTRSVIDTALAMVMGGVVIYGVGVTWLHFATGLPWGETIQIGMTVFLVSDALKIAAAAGLFPLVWRQLTKAGLAPREDDISPEAAGSEVKTGVHNTTLAKDNSTAVVDLTDSNATSSAVRDHPADVVNPAESNVSDSDEDSQV
jgi:biotin transport system substrate-specific component